MNALSTPKITVLALVLLITGAIDNVRNLPMTALFGSSLIFFFILSAVIFLIPVALVSAELASTWSDEDGGVYSWVHHAFGSTWAFFTIWFQWINTLVWFPTIISFIAGALAYLIAPELAQNKYYLIVVIISVFWSLTYLGLNGLHASARFASFCAILGMILPMIVLIVLTGVWVVSHRPLAIHLSWSNLIPNLHHTQTWSSLTAIMTSYLGMELAAVHVRQIKNPQRNFPRAMLFSVLFILITMILGSLSIAFVLPHDDISLVQGFLQTFETFFQAYHVHWLMPVVVIMILLGSLGSMVNWVISPAKGLLLAVNHGFLPPWLYRLNRHGVASHILITQAVIVTLLCGAFLLFPTVNAIYWYFTSLSTEIYMFMYVMIFLSAMVLKIKHAHRQRPFAIPGGRLGYFLTCILGLGGSLLTIIVGFFPPEDHLVSGHQFRLIFGSGLVLTLLPAVMLYCRQLHTSKKD